MWLSKQITAVLKALVRGYRRYFSALKPGPTCRFEPTCSTYALQALEAYNPLKALILIGVRLAKCGPWHPGGIDPVVPRKRKQKRISKHLP